MGPSENIVVASFYRFVRLEDYREWREPLHSVCRENSLYGTILLAAEGINATVAGTRRGIDRLMDYLYRDPRFTGLEYKEVIHARSPFYRMKVKLRKEIVTLGIPDIDPDTVSGVRVSAENWNRLITDPEVLVLDVRNRYECEVGTFRNAVSPETRTFREFPDYVRQHLDPKRHKKVAMFCTGGIRCEKAGAFMLKQGFEEVYQLQGGILRYLEQTAAEDSLWEGECFVFDGRVSVDGELRKGEHEQCYACRNPVSPEARLTREYEEGVSCPQCYDSLTPERRASLEERQRQVRLADMQNRQHIGVPQANRRDSTG